MYLRSCRSNQLKCLQIPELDSFISWTWMKQRVLCKRDLVSKGIYSSELPHNHMNKLFTAWQETICVSTKTKMEFIIWWHRKKVYIEHIVHSFHASLHRCHQRKQAWYLTTKNQHSTCIAIYLKQAKLCQDMTTWNFFC